MLYPVYVHPGDETHAHGAIVPDFPGCYSAADSWEDLPAAIQEAVEVYCEGEDAPVPEPTPLERLAEDPRFEGGVWMLFDIDVARLQGPAQRINLTVPAGALRAIDQAAKASNESRSAFLTRAGLALAREQIAKRPR
ncbi:type II toxin-antitoxin system HicB family antitoxin [Ectothiorhodospiraceae bacterium 2226]|nr:type II toxin-antitoxin system HicB family antitoxin [Ectothiorhodospiraceae bacterium 2226]